MTTEFSEEFEQTVNDISELIMFGDLTGEIDETVLILSDPEEDVPTLICLTHEQANAIADMVSALQEELRDTGIIAWGPAPDMEK